jgi:hypothetical protein
MVRAVWILPADSAFVASFDYLEKFVRESAAFRAVNQARPMKVNLTFTQVD